MNKSNIMNISPFFEKQLLINNIIKLNIDVLNIVKEYLFHKIQKIPKNDIRYDLLQTIPNKEYDPVDDTVYVYMQINDDKDYFMVYKDCKIQLQTLKYIDNVIYFIDGSTIIIE